MGGCFVRLTMCGWKRLCINPDWVLSQRDGQRAVCYIVPTLTVAS